MNFESKLGNAVIELIQYWHEIGDNPKYRLRIATGGNPQFSKATRTEKRMLSLIKENANEDEWNKIEKIFNKAEKFIINRYKRRNEEYNSLIEQKKIFEEKDRIKEKEYSKKTAEAKRKEEERRRKIEQDNEQRRIKELEKEVLKRRQKEKEEEQRRLQKAEEKKRKLREIENLFSNDYLGSRQIWLDKFSNWVSEDEFNDLAGKYVIKWFGQQFRIDQEQALCIANVWDDIQVKARAGSGKTSTIVNRATFLVKHCGVSPLEILLLAFNKDAATELNDRLHKNLGENKPQAMTFHALAYALVHPEEALICDDEVNGFSKSSTIQDVIDSHLRDRVWSDRIMELMLKYFRADWEKIESRGCHLKPEEMVMYRRLIPYIGLDGKYYKSNGEKRLADFLFEHDIPYIYEKNFWWGGLNYRPDFTIPLHKQALKGIVIEYFGITGDAEYDKLTRMKQNFWKNKSDYKFIEIFPGQADFIEILKQTVGVYLFDCGFKMRRLSEIEIWRRIKGRAVDEFSLTVSQFIGRCRKGLISPGNLKNTLNNQSESLSMLQFDFINIVWKIYTEYLQMLSANNEDDFEGLLIRAEEVVKTGKGSWHRKVGSGNLSRIKYLFIDEYQDFSLLFYRLVSAIKFMNQEVKVFCVGDDWQAINAFAGSDLRFFRDFHEYFPDAKHLNILSNHRSYKTIINISNQLMDGEGKPSKGALPNLGEVYVANIDEFIPDDLEKKNYSGDCITPALIRVVNSYIEKGQRVALLCRRRSGLPWYTPYTSVKRKFHEQFISTVKEAFSEEQKSLVVAMDTVHSYKGKEEDAIS